MKRGDSAVQAVWVSGQYPHIEAAYSGQNGEKSARFSMPIPSYGTQRISSRYGTGCADGPQVSYEALLV
jgi:hypothetical protein